MVNTGSNNGIPNIAQPVLDESGRMSRQWYTFFAALSNKNTSYGDGAPTNTPSAVGDEYLDTTNSKLYEAFGVSSAADWILIN